MASTLPNLAILRAIAEHDPASPAIVHGDSQQSFSYGSLLQDVVAAKDRIWDNARGTSLEGERIAFLAENSYDYVVMFLAILAHEAVAIPLSHSFPASELRYLLENSEAKILLSTPKFRKKAEEVWQTAEETRPTAEEMRQTAEEMRQMGPQQRPLLIISEAVKRGSKAKGHVDVSGRSSGKGGFMLYTSGTTNRPKGVLLSTSVITAQARSLIEAWEYTSADLLLHLLPLHHIHGTVNALFAPLLAGAAVEFLFPFNPDATWKRLAAPFLPSSAVGGRQPITFMTAVPTIYNRLLSTHPSLDQVTQEAARTAISPTSLRLNISGSAALPTPTKAAWTALSSGNILLERYGMTEVGMALSCGLDPADRVDGSVGWPLPSVEVRLVDADTNRVVHLDEQHNNQPREGEIQLRGPTIFSEYWRNPKATEQEFVRDEDGGDRWFKTGDIAMRKLVHGTGHSSQNWAKGPMYFIRGRKSVDIIKSGGEKVSALEVERELLSLPEVLEAAVVGVPSDKWGQKIAAIIVLDRGHADSGKGGKTWGAMDMRRALRDRLANYKIPQELKVVDNIPKNAMGKVNKKSLAKDLLLDPGKS